MNPFKEMKSVEALNQRHSPYQRLEDEPNRLCAPSIVLPDLQDNERLFFELVASGDTTIVSNFLKENPEFNINCVNFQGVSALLVAVHTRCEPMVELLLEQRGIDIGDCALHAVRQNQPKIVEMLLNKLQKSAPSLEFVGVTHSTEFSDNMTPLILAAQCGYFEMIHMLIKRGHTIKMPHSPKCRCQECLAALDKDDLLHLETSRLNLYRAIVNPAFICQTNYDPILTAFLLHKELTECSFLVPEFRGAFNELAAQVSAFAVDLIACCRSTNEMELVLSQKAGATGVQFFEYPRLILALDLKQKDFIAHQNTQQIVETAWRENWHEYRLKPLYVRVLYPIKRLFTLPLITVMSIITPKSKWVKHWNIPLNKMISHVAGYLVFLGLIFAESYTNKVGQHIRKPSNPVLQAIIAVFVAGNVWSMIRMIIIQGPKRFFRYLWNWHAIITNSLFIVTFIFWIGSYFDLMHEGEVNLERKYWHHLDPVLIAEGTFAIATIMSFFKLMFFCRLNYFLGPLQISLGKMCADMAKYATIFCIIILSFSAGMCTFYQYYDGMVQVDGSGIKTAQVSSFVGFVSTLKTFFWAVLCMSPLESADVIVENLPGESKGTYIINKHTFTETVGYIAFAVFEVLTVVMILNMLVATMSSTFQRVLDNLDTEWTFGKTDFYIEYMLQTPTPSPFNLVPTTSGIINFVRLLGITKKKEASKAAMTLEYPALMSCLVQRYFRDKDLQDGSSQDMEEMKQDVNELKMLLRELQATLPKK